MNMAISERLPVIAGMASIAFWFRRALAARWDKNQRPINRGWFHKPLISACRLVEGVLPPGTHDQAPYMDGQPIGFPFSLYC